MNPSIRQRHRPAGPGTRPLALFASLSLAAAGLLGIALAPAASAEIVDTSTTRYPGSFTFICPIDDVNPWRVDPDNVYGDCIRQGSNGSLEHTNARAINGNCDSRPGFVLDGEGWCTQTNWRARSVKGISQVICDHDEEITVAVSNVEGYATSSISDVDAQENADDEADRNARDALDAQLEKHHGASLGPCTGGSQEPAPVTPAPAAAAAPAGDPAPSPAVDYCPNVDGLQWENYDCLTGIPAAAPALAAVVETAVTVALPAAATVPAKRPAVAVSVPQAAIVPSAVPSGGGSSAPSSLPMWALAMLAAGALGAAGASRRLQGSSTE